MVRRNVRERRPSEGIRGSPEGFNEEGRVRIEQKDEEDGGGRDEVSGFSLLFPLIKISNMITADLATIIERLAVEFAELALAPQLAPGATVLALFLFPSSPPTPHPTPPVRTAR